MTATINVTMGEIAESINVPVWRWAHRCHAISVQIVKSGVLGRFARVARGGCTLVGGQHSWIVLARDCYAANVPIMDPTLWSYQYETDSPISVDPYLWWGTGNPGAHIPHGYASIWEWGRPNKATGKAIELTPTFELSQDAERFLELLGPLDREGWRTLSDAPVLGWPCGEIFAAMADTEGVSHFLQIDKYGMTTDRNPAGLYLARKGSWFKR